MTSGDRPFCDARTWGKVAGGPQADLHREWMAFGASAYGNPFVIDTKADTYQAICAGSRLRGGLDRVMGVT